MRLSKPFVGLLSFFIVLFTMPLGHAAMILMEKFLGRSYLYHSAILLGIIGFALLLWGMRMKNSNWATFMGFAGGLLVWTGWIEFAYVYYAHRYGVPPLIIDGKIVTKPEYLIMPSSVGFFAIAMIYYFFGTKTRCKFFLWVQKTFRIKKALNLDYANKNTALITFIEINLVLWACYLALLFAYDERFFGVHSIVTYIVAFGSLLWSGTLMIKLWRVTHLDYAIKYAIPTVILFWNFIEVLSRWGVIHEIWIEPVKYWKEILLMLVIFVVLVLIALLEKGLSPEETD